MDFEGNLERIRESIIQARTVHGARLRAGPELETTGYSCEDHFSEPDTTRHSWQIIYEIIKMSLDKPYDDMLMAIGAPVIHKGCLYNCMIFIFNGKICHIKPKGTMCDDGNYRESRWFVPWLSNELVDISLPPDVAGICEQSTAPFGNAIMRSEEGFSLSAEICEEAWVPHTLATDLFLQGTHIIVNGSGSLYHIQKLKNRVKLITTPTERGGGIYLYANLKGCDGQRYVFDGCPVAAMNGELYGLGQQFSYEDVEVISMTVNLADIDRYRAALAPSRQAQGVASIQHKPFPVIDIPGFSICSFEDINRPDAAIDLQTFCFEEEIALGASIWLWDYLRRSGAKGFFLPLSGGVDSAATCALVGVMAQRVLKAYNEFNGYNKDQINKAFVKIMDKAPDSYEELMKTIMYTCYMGTTNSSEETKERSRKMAEEIGSYHMANTIDEMYKSISASFATIANTEEPRFASQGGTQAEDLALQNMQARSRMVLAYSMSQLLMWRFGKEGFLLVLGSSNLDEGLRGYLTKYDCSSADLNPIGCVNKNDLKAMLSWLADNMGYPALHEVIRATPTAELRPLGSEAEVVQDDETDMGMTYAELAEYGTLRKQYSCGPVSMFRILVEKWGQDYDFRTIADKVKHFFKTYSQNRHKMNVATPAYYIDTYCIDDNRYDNRQLLYNTNWEWQFAEIDKAVVSLETTGKFDSAHAWT